MDVDEDENMQDNYGSCSLVAIELRTDTTKKTNKKTLTSHKPVEKNLTEMDEIKMETKVLHQKKKKKKKKKKGHKIKQ